MKMGEGSARCERKAEAVIFVGVLTAIVLFGVLLWIAIMSIDGAKGLYKTSPDAPDSLASLGAPRSQLDLERMFSSMKAEYSEGGETVCEPITAEYRKNAERTSLSVEEILYIISDSVELYDSFDRIRLIGEDGARELEITPIKDLAAESVPYHVAAKTRSDDVLSIIKYRIFALSSDEVVREEDGKYIYIPEYTERDGGRSFSISDEIVFHTDGGRSVRLYPTDKIEESFNSTVLAESKRALGRAEREVLTSSGYDADACRNVTPEYMYGKTDMRLVAVGGRIVIIDVKGYVAFDALPRSEKFLSVALFDGSLYITGSSGEASSLWKYESGSSISLVYSADEECIGVFVDGESMSIYSSEKRESKKYITVLVRSGEPVLTIER